MAITAQLEKVTPALAAEWLTMNKRNRHLRPSTVTLYARDMKAGAWHSTGEAIKFDEDGSLQDGQHRLEAIIRAKVTIEMLVVRGLPSEAQDVMDTGIKRTAADALKLAGYQYHMGVAASARVAKFMEEHKPESKLRELRTARFSNAEIIQYVEDHPPLVDAVASAYRYAQIIDIPVSITGYAWYRLVEIDKDACSGFFESIANAATDGRGDPRATLIQRLNQARRDRERVNGATQLQWLFTTWNKWRAGESNLRLLTGRPDATLDRYVPKPK